VRIVDIPKRFAGIAVGGWLGVVLLVAVGATFLAYHRSQSTNGAYLKGLIENHMIEKAASGFVVSARKAGGGEVSEDIKKGTGYFSTMTGTISQCLGMEAIISGLHRCPRDRPSDP
jgi:hypothetical protein